jgi:hypothetical protein
MDASVYHPRRNNLIERNSGYLDFYHQLSNHKRVTWGQRSQHTIHFRIVSAIAFGMVCILRIRYYSCVEIATLQSTACDIETESLDKWSETNS